MSESLASKAARGGRWTAISAAASVSIQLAQLGILGRLLDPSDFGLMAMMMLMIGLANTLADFGIANYIVRSKDMSGRQCSSLLLVSLSCATLLALIIGLGSPLAAVYFKRPALTGMIPVLGLGIVLTSVGQVGMALLQREMRFRSIALAEIGSGLTGLIVGTSCALAGMGVWSLIAAQLAAMGSKSLLVWGTVRQIISLQKPAWDSGLFIALRFGMFQTGERTVNFTGQNVDKIIVGRILGDTGLGMYSIAYQLVMRPFSLLNPIFTRVALPLFSRIQDDDRRLINGYLQMVRTIGLASFPIYLVMIVAVHSMVKIMLGPQWAGISPLIQILSIVGIIYSLSNPIGLLFVAKNHADWGFYYNLVAVAVYAGALFLGSKFGTLGVAVALVIVAVGVLFPIEFFFRWALIGMTIKEYMKALKPLTVALILPVATVFLFRIISHHAAGMAWDGIEVFVALSLYSSIVWVTERNLVLSTIELLKAK